MKLSGLPGGCWPLPWQEHVIRAAVGPAENSAVEWERALAGGTLDDVWDGQVGRILPMVYRRLAAAAPGHPDLPRLKGLYRRTWYQNRTLMARTLPILDALEAAGFRPVVLKGAALSTIYYQDLGVRPMGDLDVLVPSEAVDDAADLLESSGFGDSHQSSREYVRDVKHGIDFTNDAGDNVDLHFQLARWLGPEVVDWDRVEDVEVSGHRARILEPTTQWLHACVHGLWSGSAATVRWIPDALTILDERGDDIDWPRLVHAVDGSPAGAVVQAAADYLAQRFDAPIPDQAQQALSAMTVSRRDRALFWATTIEPWLPVFGQLPQTFSAWVRSRNGQGLIASGRQLPEFLQTHWQLRNTREIPGEILAKARRRTAEPRRGEPAPEPGSHP